MRRRQLVGSVPLVFTMGMAGAQAQSGKSYRLGILTLASDEGQMLMPLLLARLAQLGYVEGRNLEVSAVSADGRIDRLARLANQLAGQQPDVLVAGFGTLTTKALKAATPSIPIVFVTVGDPVGSGVIASLAKPGGNITGLTDQATDIGGKRLALLQDATGGKKSFAVMTNPETPNSALALDGVRRGATPLQVQLKVLEVRTVDEVRDSIVRLAGGSEAGLMLLEDPLTVSARGQIVALTAAQKLPTMFLFREAVLAGGLMSYGSDRERSYVRAAEYVDLIFKGRKPADLPVEQPTTFQFVINMKTAKAIGLVLPPTILRAADEVIE